MVFLFWRKCTSDSFQGIFKTHKIPLLGAKEDAKNDIFSSKETWIEFLNRATIFADFVLNSFRLLQTFLEPV